MKSPQITYDPEANALYLQFSENEIAETVELSEAVYVDVDADGLLVGIEVLDATAEVLSGLPTLPDVAELMDLLHPDTAQRLL
jgi:uncharacterized protein YuzE